MLVSKGVSWRCFSEMLVSQRTSMQYPWPHREAPRSGLQPCPLFVLWPWPLASAIFPNKRVIPTSTVLGSFDRVAGYGKFAERRKNLLSKVGSPTKLLRKCIGLDWFSTSFCWASTFVKQNVLDCSRWPQQGPTYIGTVPSSWGLQIRNQSTSIMKCHHSKPP